MIYVSTCCLKNPHNIIHVLNEYQKSEISNVELGSIHNPFDIKQENGPEVEGSYSKIMITSMYTF